MGAANDPERTPRRGCLCVLFITEADGTHPRSYTPCLTHKRIARENCIGD